MRFGLSNGYPDEGIEEAPDYAAPSIEGVPVIMHPPSIGDTGNGEEGRQVGKAYMNISRREISGAGFFWYYNYYVNSDNGNDIWVQAFDMERNSWCVYSAKMKRPTHSNQGLPRDTPTVLGFQCRFTDMVFVAEVG